MHNSVMNRVLAQDFFFQTIWGLKNNFWPKLVSLAQTIKFDQNQE